MGIKIQLLGVAFALSFLAQRYSPTSIVGFVFEALGLFFVELLLYLAWTILIYPQYFSPLRAIPEAPNGRFFTGHTRKIMADPSGQPMREWIESVPNDGLIRYRNWGTYRIAPTSPKALSEVLVTKNYDFEKPKHLVKGLGRLLGVGVLLAEGDEHKRQRKNLMPAFAFRYVSTYCIPDIYRND